MIKVALFTALVALSTLTGCEQWQARHMGGKMDVNLPACTKFVNATWKGENAELWYITRPMRAGEQPENFTFHASTQFGVLEGTVVFIEHACT